MEQKKNSLSIAALILGIVGIVFDFIVTWIGLIVGIVGIIVAVQARKKEEPNGMATGGLVCSIIAVVLAGLFIACAICAVGTLLSAYDISNL